MLTRLCPLLATLLLAACASGTAPVATHGRELRMSSAALSVPEIEAAIAWYRSTLGLEVAKRLEFPALGLRLAWLRSAELELELVEQNGSRDRARLVSDAGNPALVQGFGKIGFRVDDIASWEARLKAAKVTFQVGMRDAVFPGSKTFVVLDNNGNWLQFTGPSR